MRIGSVGEKESKMRDSKPKQNLLIFEGFNHRVTRSFTEVVKLLLCSSVPSVAFIIATEDTEEHRKELFRPTQ